MVFVVLEIEPNALNMLSKHFITALHAYMTKCDLTAMLR